LISSPGRITTDASTQPLAAIKADASTPNLSAMREMQQSPSTTVYLVYWVLSGDGVVVSVGIGSPGRVVV